MYSDAVRWCMNKSKSINMNCYKYDDEQDGLHLPPTKNNHIKSIIGYGKRSYSIHKYISKLNSYPIHRTDENRIDSYVKTTKRINRKSNYLFSDNVHKCFIQLLISWLILNLNVICVWGDDLSNTVSDSTGGHYTPTWAVHIPDGDTVAEDVARDHGFVLLGKIVDDHYHFGHPKVVKRSLSPSHHHQRKLHKDERVNWAGQQIAKSRQKRDTPRSRSFKVTSANYHLNDVKWQQMWYLHRGQGLDMNVIPAWKEGYNGSGVVVTILDDGLETDHPDLAQNYDPLASYDVNSHDADPMPRYDMSDSNRHGTRCAGEVAAIANNSLCSVGIAFGAHVGGVRMLDGDVTDAVEARSLSLNPQHIDIYSASWGPDDDGKTVDGPGPLALKAFQEGVAKGRSGKGSIFIWASGNGGREHDNCNCDGYTNSIYTLSISSTTEHGDIPWYSEKCSSTLATTYSSGNQGEHQIVTTDLHHSCTTSHTGTSASAPLAAGIAALVLEANNNLTWRDLQHIVVRTAKPMNLKDPSWSVNGVGRYVSHSFGYGLMDAYEMVKLARVWQTVPEQHKCEVSAPHLNKSILPRSHIVLQLEVLHCKGVNFLEHVQARLTLATLRRGEIQIFLTSPAQTKVTLLTSRLHDISRIGFQQWPFMSVHTWGEAPHGKWLLEIHNEGRYSANISQWDLIFHGTTDPPQSNEPTRDDYKSVNVNYGEEVEHNSLDFDNKHSNGQWRDVPTVVESHSDVLRTPSPEAISKACLKSSTNNTCLECEPSDYMFDGRCFSSCPDGSFKIDGRLNEPESNSGSVEEVSNKMPRDLEQTDDAPMKVDLMKILTDMNGVKQCGRCFTNCLRCNGPSPMECTECVSNYTLIEVSELSAYCSVLAETITTSTFMRLEIFYKVMFVGSIITATCFIIIFIKSYFCKNQKDDGSDRANYSYLLVHSDNIENEILKKPKCDSPTTDSE